MTTPTAAANAAAKAAAAKAVADTDYEAPDGQSHRNPNAEEHVESTSSVLAAIAANILIGIVKFIAAGISGSSAMISEGIHSIVDSGNGMLILLGLKKAKRAADQEHPFGYGTELYFWTLVVAIMIFALGGGFSIYEGYTHLREVGPDTVLGNPTMNYIVIGASIILEGASLSVALRNFNKARGDIRPMQFIREAKDPSLFTVVFEDSAALMGLIIALAGVFFSHLLNNPYLDSAASILIGLLLCTVAIVLLRETKGLLIGEGMKGSEVREIEAIVEANDQVIECGRVLSLYMGPHDVLLTIDATFVESAGRDDIVDAIDEIEGHIVERFPDVTRVFIETESLRHTRAVDLM
ncbi:cation diffusion facilitator family transporter [Slackia heliotrinireducens]|uniref:cation diffusion facilitator family transporter n=1 Tax=Slackia heliotrinireducens TaxID=84110 RepID=UPI003315B8A8